MDGYFDLEEALLQVNSKKTQKYLKEVLSTYYNGEYRSCIVMLYATTYIDALEKIKIMAEEYQNDKAAKFLEDYENKRKANEQYSNLERDIKDYTEKSGLINDVEKKQWEHLKDYRDYCAHPVVSQDYELISPNSEQVRMHIRNMFEALFLKDAILTDDKIFDEFLLKIESFYDRNGLDELKEYVNKRYINKLSAKAKKKFVKNLWKITFFIDNEECNKYRIIALYALTWIINSDRPLLLSYLQEESSFFNGRINFQEVNLKKSDDEMVFQDNRTLSLFMFLFFIPEVYDILSPDNKTEIKSISKKNINLILVSPYLYGSRESHTDEIIKELNGQNFCLITSLANELFEQAYNHFDYSYNRLVIYYFFNCQNSPLWSPDYDFINITYKKLVKVSLPHFEKTQLEEFIQNITEKYTKANCFKELANQIIKIDENRSFSIDFSSFDINLTEYVET